MGRGAIVLVVCAVGCGRVGFDARGDGATLDTTFDVADAPAFNAVLWAPMDENTATMTFADIAGGHSITCTAPNCPMPIAGRHAGALHFDGAERE